MTIFLENPGLSFSPPQIPFHPTPRGYYPSLIMSRQSSMFSQTPETLVSGSPSVPSGYQSLSGTFSGGSPRPIEQVLSSRSNGTQALNAEEILMMSGSSPNPQPQGSQLPPRGQPQGSQLRPGGQPQGSQLPPGGQPQGSQLLPGEQPQGTQLSPGGQPQGSQLPPGGKLQGQYIPSGHYIPQGQP